VSFRYFISVLEIFDRCNLDIISVFLKIFDHCHGEIRTVSRRYFVGVLEIFDRCLGDI